jgi:hypothetical protein
MVEGGTRADAASVLSENLLAELSDHVRDAGSTFSASPFIDARSGEARADLAPATRAEPPVRSLVSYQPMS